MKTKTKALLLVFCAILLVAATVAATLAYLKDTDEVTNTFTVGKVDITLDEAEVGEDGKAKTPENRVKANEYHLIPGTTYDKDPTIHVADDSEDCWLFAKVENGLGDKATLDISTTDWTLIDAENGIYAFNTIAEAGDDAIVFTQFTFSSDVDETTIGDYEDKEIVVTAYAVQSSGFSTAEAAWIATFGAAAAETTAAPETTAPETEPNT